MARIDEAILELRQMDELAEKDTFIHRLHPLAKLIVTIAYIGITLSFALQDLSGPVTMILYPAILFPLSEIPVKLCFRKMKYIFLLVGAIGIFNPIFDRTPVFALSGIIITGGMISMVTLFLKAGLCLMASFLLAATTSIDALCRALRCIHVPEVLVTLLLLTYRYIALFMEEVSIMTTAYHLRAPGQKGIHYKAWGSFLGQLFLRTVDRAQEVYDAMVLRGFEGNFSYVSLQKIGGRDLLFCGIVLSALLFLRFVSVAGLIGRLFM